MKGWVIPHLENGDFLAHMEHVLNIYKTPYDEAFPVVCMDESLRQLIKETRTPVAMAPGREQRQDYEYECCGVASVFMANEPLKGKRYVQIIKRKTKKD